MRLLFATTNKGKLAEAKAFFAGRDFDVVYLADFPELADMDVAETGSTFEENALIKAEAYAAATQVLTVAEDTGLSVSALDGRPGVYSARYAESDEARNSKLLGELQSSPDRSAEFVSVLCLFNPVDQVHHFFTGKVMGTIAESPRGDQGFGYDPVFIPEGYTETFAELGPSVKNTMSHRAKALSQLKEYLETH